MVLLHLFVRSLNRRFSKKIVKMKVFVFICVIQFIAIATCKTLPEHFPDPCKKSDPDYRGCVLKALDKVAPYVLKGIPEYNIPKMDPLQIPLITVNRTLNDFISIKAELKDVRMVGLSKTYINDFKANLETMSGELKLTQPFIYLTMEYDVAGQLFTVPLESRGYFRGNFTDITLHFKGSLKTTERDGVKYFALDKFKLKSRIGDGYIKMTAKNPREQFAADLITTFFNENPRRVLDALNPFYVDRGAEFYRAIIEYGLATVSAEELLPQ